MPEILGVGHDVIFSFHMTLSIDSVMVQALFFFISERSKRKEYILCLISIYIWIIYYILFYVFLCLGFQL